MGHGASSSGKQVTLADYVLRDVDGAEINTPRGESAKLEVVRLKQVLVERNTILVEMMMRNKFNELDTNQSGSLEEEELVKVMEWVMTAFGDQLGADPVLVKRKVMERIDVNKDGKLDFDEFKTLFVGMLQRESLLFRAQNKFREIDSDNSGFIENKELDRLITWTLSAYPDIGDSEKYKTKLLNEVDRNSDGKIDIVEFTNLFEDIMIRTELLKRAQAKFQELDEDKSGRLERQEIDKLVDWVLTAYVEKSPAERESFKLTLIQRIDANNDGVLSLQEFAALFDEVLNRMDLIKRAKLAFQKLDKDNSGYLEKEELSEVAKVWAQESTKESGMNLVDPINDMLLSCDANSDGKLSLLEFVQIFDKLLSTTGFWAL